MSHKAAVLDFVLYSFYASTIQEVVPQEQVDLHSYTDDHGLKRPFRPGTTEENNAISTLQNTTSDIKEWVDSNHLKMNSSKTEYIIYGTCQQLAKCVSNSININGAEILKNNCIKNLGVWTDIQLSCK